jgi:hypothetical protein
MGFHSRVVKVRFSLVAINLLPRHSGHGLEVGGKLAALTKVLLVSRVHPFNLSRDRVTVPFRTHRTWLSTAKRIGKAIGSTSSIGRDMHGIVSLTIVHAVVRFEWHVDGDRSAVCHKSVTTWLVQRRKEARLKHLVQDDAVNESASLW